MSVPRIDRDHSMNCSAETGLCFSLNLVNMRTALNVGENRTNLLRFPLWTQSALQGLVITVWSGPGLWTGAILVSDVRHGGPSLPRSSTVGLGWELYR